MNHQDELSSQPPGPKPRTEARRASSRRNGSKSRGPVTPEGKARSVRNNFRHGVVAKAIILEGESREIFNYFMAGLEATFRPESPYQVTLVETMAIAKWRQMRLAGMERAAVRCQLRQHAEQENKAPLPADTATRAYIAYPGLSQHTRTLELMSRYGSRCDRQYNHALTFLLEARRRREVKADGEISLEDLR
jgi:hypothetical protein